MTVADRVTWHAERVVSGEIPYPVGRLHVLACQRHLNDLARQGTPEFPYVWDVDAANDILEYAETLTIGEGMNPKPVSLDEEQAFDIGARFGWKKPNGYRRFRRSYESEARQEGKTFKNGIMGSYIAGFSGYRYGKLFTVATRKRQARLAWEEIAKFIKSDPELEYDKLDNPEGYFHVMDYKSTIEAVSTKCTIEALSQEAGLQDGFRSIFSSIDEIHQHKDNRIYKAIYNGTRALPETLVSMITTRGEQLNSFCFEMDSYAIKILEGTATAEDFFVDIYSLDKGDDPFDEANWWKANPHKMRDPELVAVLRADAQTARDMGGQDLRDFLVKALNMWVQNTDNEFIDAEKWTACGCDDKLAAYAGRSCYAGLDLSSGGDLTTLALEFPEQGNEPAYIYSHSFMPRGRLEEHLATDLAPYDLWEEMGLITVTGGATDYKNDYKFIIRHLAELQERYDLRFTGIGIDPHNADGILADLEAFGCPVMLVTQSARALNDATVDMQLVVKSGRIRYDRGNELLTWSFVNASLVRNSFDEVKVDKKPGQRFKRIDPVDAVIDAHAMMLKAKEEQGIDAESELDEYLVMMGWK